MAGQTARLRRRAGRVGWPATLTRRGKFLRRNTDLLPSLAIVLTGLLWGSYWIPLRELDAAGLGGPWATLAPVAAGAALLMPVAVARWRRLAAGGWPLVGMGLLCGASFSLYSNALLMSEIITVILLFYLTPVWATLRARVFLGQPITAIRILTILLGIGGMAIVLGIDDRIPLPRGLGDWLGLISGIAWALASVIIRKRGHIAAIDNTIAFLAGSTLVAIALPILAMPAEVAAVDPLAIPFGTIAPLLALTTLVWAVPTIVLMMWGTQRLDPGRVGILLMSEVLVGTVTAAILTDEPFGARQIIGGGLIVAAALIDVLAHAPEANAAQA